MEFSSPMARSGSCNSRYPSARCRSRIVRGTLLLSMAKTVSVLCSASKYGEVFSGSAPSHQLVAVIGNSESPPFITSSWATFNGVCYADCGSFVKSVKTQYELLRANVIPFPGRVTIRRIPLLLRMHRRPVKLRTVPFVCLHGAKAGSAGYRLARCQWRLLKPSRQRRSRSAPSREGADRPAFNLSVGCLIAAATTRMIGRWPSPD